MQLKLATIVIMILHLLAVAQTSSNAAVTEFELKQNFPNPFNASTTIEFSLPRSERVTLALFDLLGNRVRTLLDEERTAGKHSLLVRLDDLPTGFYLYQLQVGEWREMRRMALIR